MTQQFPTVAVVGLGSVGAALVRRLSRSSRRVIAVEHTAGIAAAAAADLVVEAVPERLGLKAEVLARADRVCPDHTVFATTTTGLSVTEIASRSGRMARTVGLHVFPSVLDNGSGAVELVRTPVTDAAALAAAEQFVAELGLTPAPVGDQPGFVGGALLMAYLNGAAAMCEQGYAARDDIDLAMRLGCGLPTGPLAQLDQIGIDVVHDTLEALHDRTGDRGYAPAHVLTTMRDAGLLGRKTGRGFYDYNAESPAPQGESAPARAAVIGVVGAGTMATGIAEVCARAGHRTVLIARTDVRAKEALRAVDESMDRAVRRGRLSIEDHQAAMDRLSGDGTLSSLAACDLVVEAVSEELSVKREIFAALDRVCAEHTVLATSTSSLPVIACATATRRPDRVIGMHFFNPAPTMRLVEIARTPLTSDATSLTAHAIAASLGRTAISCPDRPGFIVNALLFPYLNRAAAMVRDRWLSADAIDHVMTHAHGFPMGPLRLLDVIGLDVSLQIQRTLAQAFNSPALASALSDLVAAGHLGRKTGRGFHPHPAAVTA
ncbi:3-hydroxyacyl-CoA dehydrogenase family protein [Kutzneria sp. NPDC052558]|uniref:3-hydroxyacyl-CoA dehydrogenase family protein n=1 Tax=Kutzneria sp. NPDC052558 TaxID=3364121 RepID=UPI0037C8ED21